MQDEGRYAVPILTVTAGMASLAAIIVWLHLTPDTESQPTHLALLFLTTLLSWAFIHTIFALHYAHEYYAEHRGKGSGLRFPGGGKPNYWDFTYFAFTIGTSNAVSDVEITSRAIRKTVTVHALVAFIFNVTMIALTVSHRRRRHLGEIDLLRGAAADAGLPEPPLDIVEHHLLEFARRARPAQGRRPSCRR